VLSTSRRQHGTSGRPPTVPGQGHTQQSPCVWHRLGRQDGHPQRTFRAILLGGLESGRQSRSPASRRPLRLHDPGGAGAVQLPAVPHTRYAHGELRHRLRLRPHQAVPARATFPNVRSRDHRKSGMGRGFDRPCACVTPNGKDRVIAPPWRRALLEDDVAPATFATMSERPECVGSRVSAVPLRRTTFSA
jgi:hypothetical protein